MENICIIDTETTGLDTTKNKVIEIAAVFYNIPTRSILSQASTLLYSTENTAYDINKIEVDSLKKVPTDIQVHSELLIKSMILKADALIAHNAEFDKKFLEAIVDFQPIIKHKKWICTKNDVIWPIRKGVPLNLVSICVALCVPIVNAHRALSDCLLLVNAMQCMDDIEYFLDKSGKDRIIYYAQVSFDQRQLVKDAGFSWDNINKVWYAKLTMEQASDLPFKVIAINK